MNIRGLVYYIIDEMMFGMEIGKQLAEKRMRNTADLRKDIRLIISE